MGHAPSRAYRSIQDRFPAAGIRPRLVVCADPVESRARGAMERFDFDHYVTDWHEVIADPEVEACLLSTSPSPRDRTTHRMPSSS